MTFWLGTHVVGWLGRSEFAAVPLMLSAVRLRRVRGLPRAAGGWALDSGGFSELAGKGWWGVSARQYVAEVRRWSGEAGAPAWCAVQDWMCEPAVRARTGLSVASHQTLTVRSYAELTQLAPELPWVPVLQGWSESDYLRHADQYAAWGFDPGGMPLVGVGSVCRRQGTREAERVVGRLARQGIRLHLFGFKTRGLRRCAALAASADSLAWSYRARAAWVRERRKMLADCSHRGGCGNCPDYARHWRATKVMPLTRRPADLFSGG